MINRTCSGFARFTGASSFCLAISLSTSAIAQEAETAPSAETTKIQEIVVTASKRSESLSKAPLAIAVLSQSELTSSGAVSVKDLAGTVPNVQLGFSGFGDGVVITLRGIQSAGIFPDGDPAVAVYIDGINIPRAQGLNGNLFDVERVEVLRGPQGTLYGRNATAGGMNIITASPKFSGIEGNILASYGNFNDIRLQGALNLPLSDTLAVRAAFAFQKNNGFWNNLGTVEDYGKVNDISGRLTALWEPSDTFKWRLSVSNTISKGTPFPSIATDANGKPLDGLPVYKRPMSADLAPDRRLTNLGVRSRMDFEIDDNWSATLLNGFGRVTYDTQFVTTGVPLPYTLYGANAAVLERGKSRNFNTSHEFNLQYDDGKLRNIAGVNFFYEDNRNWAGFPIYQFGIDYNFIIPHTWQRSIGIFNELTYSVTDQLDLTGGIRYTWDKKGKGDGFIAICGFNYAPGFFNYDRDPNCGNSDNGAGGEWSKANWKVNASYKMTPETLIYATIATGYKAGGNGDVNPFTGLQPPSYDPENIRNYELGFKTRSIDGALAFNAAIFYMDYKDIQIQQVQQPIGQIITNAGAAKVYGIEAEANWRPTRATRISLFGNLLHAKYSKYDNATDELTGTTYASLKGNLLPQAADFSARGKVEHDFAVGSSMTLTPMVSVFYQTKSYLRAFNLPADRIPAYSKTDAELKLSSDNGWSLAAYVQNLENKAIRTATYPLVGLYLSYYGAPRTYGLRAMYNF